MFYNRVPGYVAFAIAGVIVAAPELKAAGDPNKAKGLMVEHCSGCHVVPGYDSEGLPTVEAPSFQDMADDPSTYTEQRLRTFLLKPHWPMEQFRLSPSDIDSIVAYVRSLAAS